MPSCSQHRSHKDTAVPTETAAGSSSKPWAGGREAGTQGCPCGPGPSAEGEAARASRTSKELHTLSCTCRGTATHLLSVQAKSFEAGPEDGEDLTQ